MLHSILKLFLKYFLITYALHCLNTKYLKSSLKRMIFLLEIIELLIILANILIGNFTWRVMPLFQFTLQDNFGES